MPVHTHERGGWEGVGRGGGEEKGNVISVSLPRSTAAFELAHPSKRETRKYADPKVDNVNLQKRIPRASFCFFARI